MEADPAVKRQRTDDQVRGTPLSSTTRNGPLTLGFLVAPVFFSLGLHAIRLFS